MTILIYTIVALYFIICAIILKGNKPSLKEVCLIGIISAMALILRCIRVPLPTGSSIALLGVLPTMLLGIIYSPQLAIISGLITAMLSIILVPGYAPVHPLQIFVEHFPALSVLGFAGIFDCSKKYKMVLGSFISIALNVLFHTVSGVLFFSQYAPSGMGAWTYSITYNLSSHGVEGIIAIFILTILPIKYLKKTLGGNTNVIRENFSR
ncbi:energy-coupled thiamine transporter ThiT [Clostridium botulinum]|uniref:energy-coupled thiamine transporter ThiT n=1 Tax=Clostridium botulinum TaxID=1491 RepID=UPI000774CBEF|nr:energy-coupled thiamine transporter ThiT [Clostridium botulinum]MBN1041679.1 energy-coupled thiamine transporter ThiT [Clostridium botulinum]MBN1070794.1 energy-coupled thiamine transporter ThiT [Clostridium botulinum]MBN1077333.1 energy-coupled thiamine transporter ThiT [Clostridium botulinum]MBY6835841.1 energy-coupled thiamine transporter ThiT [Clostridium botulinum]MBY6917704.1 energy-coupled thiamine transporter ThiT [Clostridium botulinum]